MSGERDIQGAIPVYADNRNEEWIVDIGDLNPTRVAFKTGGADNNKGLQVASDRARVDVESLKSPDCLTSMKLR